MQGGQDYYFKAGDAGQYNSDSDWDSGEDSFEQEAKLMEYKGSMSKEEEDEMFENRKILPMFAAIEQNKLQLANDMSFDRDLCP